jgi:hypothetical protein
MKNCTDTALLPGKAWTQMYIGRMQSVSLGKMTKPNLVLKPESRNNGL